MLSPHLDFPDYKGDPSKQASFVCGAIRKPYSECGTERSCALSMIGCTPKGSYSPRGAFWAPSGNPLLRTPSANPSQNLFSAVKRTLRTLLRTLFQNPPQNLAIIWSPQRSSSGPKGPKLGTELKMSSRSLTAKKLKSESKTSQKAEISTLFNLFESFSTPSLTFWTRELIFNSVVNFGPFGPKNSSGGGLNLYRANGCGGFGSRTAADPFW